MTTSFQVLSCFIQTEFLSQAVTTASDWLKAGRLSHDPANGGRPCPVFLSARTLLDEPVDFLQVSFAAKLLEGNGYNLGPRRNVIHVLSRCFNPDCLNRNAAE